MPTKGDYLSADTIRAIQQGSADADEELYRYISEGSIRYWIYSKIRRTEDAEDVIQDSFLIALQEIRDGKILDENSGPTYVRSIIWHRIIAWYRWMYREQKSLDIDTNFLILRDRNPDPMKVVCIREEKARIEKAVQELPTQRQRLLMHRLVVLGEDDKDVRKKMKLTTNQFRTDKSEGKKALIDIVSRMKAA
jgi:RNA polymerase sigma factor (sigma-70 family)